MDRENGVVRAEVVFALSRRQLGQAIQKNVAISVFAFQDVPPGWNGVCLYMGRNNKWTPFRMDMPLLWNSDCMDKTIQNTLDTLIGWAEVRGAQESFNRMLTLSGNKTSDA